MSGISIAIAVPAGVLLAIFFYSGLWYTVRRLASTGHPILLTIGSFWIRMAIALTGFVILARRGLVDVTLAMAGFVAGRFVVSQFLPERRRASRCT